MAEDIGELKAKGDAHALIQLLAYDGDACVRREAANALRELGGRAVKPLIRALRSRDEALREAVSDVLHRMDRELFQNLALSFEQQEVVMCDFAQALSWTLAGVAQALLGGGKVPRSWLSTARAGSWKRLPRVR